VWPPKVEVIAAVFRAAGADARLEELPEGEEEFPGLGINVDAFDCDGRVVVALVPADRDVDVSKLGCTSVTPVDVPPFPYAGSRIVLDSSLLTEPMVWLEAGSDRHVVGVGPSQLVRIIHAQTGDLVAES
jgi:prolyl-tRNA editing enzyme YbaK/EbsC (Cys-tRNA(Pro) deacylase)